MIKHMKKQDNKPEELINILAKADHLKGKNFLKLLDFTPEDMELLLDIAAKLKKLKKARVPHKIYEGRNIALIFEKTSTRTRCAFEVAAADLGIHPVYLDPKSSQMGKKESIADTARVLGRMFDGIEYRGFGQEIVEEIARYAGVPVWNGLTNEFHPTQILADLLTIREHFGGLKGRKLVYLGDARYNMGNSLMVGCAMAGMDFVACAPEKYMPEKDLIEKSIALAKTSGGSVSFETDPEKAVEGADVLYTDVWVSMGEPDNIWAERISDLLPYRVTMKLMDKAGPQCRFMHCLPSFHDLRTETGAAINAGYGLDCMEVTDEVFESSRSIVFDEAENRMHTIKAVIAATMI
jgi:ornithine carbamoyltransferase